MQQKNELVTMQTKKVIVSVWQPEWQICFEELREELCFHLEGMACAIEHVGSTSVAVLAAKAILDVDIVIPNREVFEQVKEKLEEIGYFHRGDLGIKGREAFGYYDKPDFMQHHLYVLTQDCEELKRHLGFRDWLRTHPEDAAEYARVKLEAARCFPEDIDAYIEVKSDFIQQIYQKAELVDPTDVSTNAWSVLVNRYSLAVNALDCQKLKPGVSGCRVSTPERAYYLLAWEKKLFGFEIEGVRSIPSATGKLVCENPHINYALFESEEQAKEFLKMNNKEKKEDNTQKFSGKADVYQKARPAYAPDMFVCLQQDFGVGPGSVVADVGSGTGILTRQLLEMGLKVFAVEPNMDMRQVAEQELGGVESFVSVAATAEHTTLPDESVDFVFAASAFHWFDPLAFKAECQRILKPGGRIFLIWNEKQLMDEIQQGRKAIFEKYSGKPSGGHKEKMGFKHEFFDGHLGELHFPNPITYDRDRFVDRELSSSYSLTESDENYEAYVAELGELFDRFSVDGIITVPQATVLYFKAEPTDAISEPSVADLL